MKSNIACFAAGLVMAIFVPLVYTLVICGILFALGIGAHIGNGRKNS